MLKKIPKSLSPELIKIMMEMGHGDEILLADANFPGNTFGQRVIRADGLPITKLLDDVLELLPLDTYSEYQSILMEVVKGDTVVPVVWDSYKEILNKHHKDVTIKQLERFDFYEQSKTCYAVVVTGEEALYGNIILKKGVIK